MKVQTSCLLVLLLPASLLAQDKIVAETWEAAYLQGTRSGYVHTVVREVERDGLKLLQSNIELRLTVKRFNDSIQLAMDSGTVETPEGVVVGTFMKQYLGKSKTLQIVGKVQGRRLYLTQDETKPITPAPWDDDVLGVYRQKTLFKDKNIKPGDEFSFRSFEPTINLVVTYRVKVKDYEDVELQAKSRRRLLRVEIHADKIQGLQLPPYIAWLDDAREPIKAQTEMPLGKVVLYQTSKNLALANVTGAAGVDVGIGHQIRLGRNIARPHQTTAASYRVSLKDEEDPGSVFAKSVGQEVMNIKGGTFELRVRPDRDEEGGAPDAAFTESSIYHKRRR